MKIISDQRGIRQEVMLIMKRGIEAKSYEGVSPLYITTNVPTPYRDEIFNTYHIHEFPRETI